MIFYDKSKVQPGEITSYEDLADPIWQGKVCIRKSSNTYNQSLLASMVAAKGEAEAEAWAKALTRRLVPLAGTSDIPAIASAFAGTLVRRRRFCELFQAVASVLEHNVSRETVLDYKRDFLRIAEPVVGAFRAAFPVLSREEAFHAVGMLVMSATGVWPHAHPPEVLRDVMSEPEFAWLKLEFRSAVEAHTDAYLRGLLARKDSAS